MSFTTKELGLLRVALSTFGLHYGKDAGDQPLLAKLDGMVADRLQGRPHKMSEMDIGCVARGGGQLVNVEPMPRCYRHKYDPHLHRFAERGWFERMRSAFQKVQDGRVGGVNTGAWIAAITKTLTQEDC